MDFRNPPCLLSCAIQKRLNSQMNQGGTVGFDHAYEHIGNVFLKIIRANHLRNEAHHRNRQYRL